MSRNARNFLHKAVEKAASEAQSEPKPKKPARQTRSEGPAYQRPKTEKVREDDLVFGKLIQDPIVSVNEAIAAYDMVTIQGEVFFTDNKDIHSKKTGKDYVKIAFDMTDRTNSVRVSKFLAADKAGDTASLIKKRSVLHCAGQNGVRHLRSRNGARADRNRQGEKSRSERTPMTA